MKVNEQDWNWFWWLNVWYEIPDWYIKFYLPILPAPCGLHASRQQRHYLDTTDTTAHPESTVELI